MMDKRTYVHFMGKPRCGCQAPEEAAAAWELLLADPSSTTDTKGPAPKYRDRVAVLYADEIIHRDAHIRSQGAEYRGKEIKNASQADVDGLEARMSQGKATKAAGSRTRLQLSKAFASAAAASELAGERDVFSGTGLAAQSCPNVKAFCCQMQRFLGLVFRGGIPRRRISSKVSVLGRIAQLRAAHVSAPASPAKGIQSNDTRKLFGWIVHIPIVAPQ
jgi:hypothetical protein